MYAVGNVNYIPGPYTITFPAGVTSVSFNISLLESDGESLSEFKLYMVYSNETMIGKYSQVVVAIIHNNGSSNAACIIVITLLLTSTVLQPNVRYLFRIECHMG